MDLTTTNDVTGDRLATKPSTDAFKEGYDRIFGKKERKQWVPPPLPEEKADEPCFCDKNNLGEPGVSCGDCPTRDYK